MDPITALLLLQGGTALAKGIGGFVGSRAQTNAELERASDALTEAGRIKEQALASREDYGLGESFSDLRQLVMQDPASDYLRQQTLRGESGQIEALESGGARALLGGTQATARGTMDELAKIAADEHNRRVSGLETVGRAEQKVAEDELVDARTDLALGRGMEAEALAAQYGAEDARRMANQMLFQTGTDAARTAGIGLYQEFGNQKYVGDDLFGNPITAAQGWNTSDPYLFQLLTGGTGIPNTFTGENGAIVRGKTPGEFSHEKNPIDVLQNGEKIGEMTGGEGIVSPEDLGQLQQLAGKGDTELHKFVRSLIAKLESNGGE